MESTEVLSPAPDVEALIKEARRRQRRRRAIIGAAVAGLLAVAATVAGVDGAGHGSPRVRLRQPGPASPPAAAPAASGLPAAKLVMWPAGGQQDSTVEVDNLSTGKHLSAAVADPGEYQPIMLVGNTIVHASDSGTRATDIRTGTTRLLGTATAFGASAESGDIWLEHVASTGSATVQSVPLSGGRAGPPVTLPRGTQLIAGTDAGMLLEQRDSEVGGPFWLWTPASPKQPGATPKQPGATPKQPGAPPQLLPGSRSAEGFAVSPRLIAYGTRCANPSTALSLTDGGGVGYYACRDLRVLNVVTGTTEIFAAPPGTIGWVPTHGGNWAWSTTEIAPSGTLMAAQAVRSPASQGVAREYVLHLSGAKRRNGQPRITEVPSSAAFLLGVTAWSPDSSWLFYQGPDQQLRAYQVPTGRIRRSKLACCQYAVMAAVGDPG